MLSKDSSVTRYGGIKLAGKSPKDTKGQFQQQLISLFPLAELNQWHNRSSFLNQQQQQQQQLTQEDFTNSSGARTDRYGQDFSLFSAYANNKTFMDSLEKPVVKDELNYTEPKYYLGKCLTQIGLDSHCK